MQAVRNAILRIICPFECAFNCPIGKNPTEDKKPLPLLPPEIWLEIFQFATYMHRFHHLAPLDPFISSRPSNNVMGPNTPYLAQRTKACLVLVCRFWHQIAIPLLYEHIVIPSPPRADIILQALENHISISPLGRVSEYGLCVRHLEVLTHARNAHTLPYLQTLFRICLLCPRLRILSGTWRHALPRDFLRGITRLYGPSLQELYWQDNKDQSLLGAVQLSSFQSLRVLDLRNYTGNDATSTSDCAHSSTLPLLEHIILSSRHASISAASTLCLPSLRTLTLKPCDVGYFASTDTFERFLQTHGPSLTTVDLPSVTAIDREPPFRFPQSTTFQHNVKPDIFLAPDMCPNLRTLTFTAQAPVISIDKPHTSLRRIGLRDITSTGLYPDMNSITRSHLLSIKRSMFPRLETVRTVGFSVESDSDMLAEDVFIWWTEHFEMDGIDFQDGAGVVWVYDEEAKVADS